MVVVMARVLALVVLMVLAMATPAAAHASLVGAEPPDGSRFDVAPDRVRLLFDEPVDPRFVTVTIRNEAGASRKPDGVKQPPGQGHAIDVDLPKLGNGAHAITWQATTSDSHTTGGDVVYAVGAGASATVDLPAGSFRGDTVVLDRAVQVGRFVWYVALAAVAGALLLLHATRGVRGRRIADRTRRTGAQTFHRFVRGGALALGVASAARAVLAVLVFARAAPGLGIVDVVDGVLATPAGKGWAALVFIGALLPLVARRPRIGAVAALVGGAALAHATTGHAAASPRAGLATASVTVHLLTFAAWFGGVSLLAYTARKRRWAGDDGDDERAGELRRALLTRFAGVALASVAALVATGLVNAWIQLDGLDGLWSEYGHILLVKSAFVAVALGVGFWHWQSGPTGRWLARARGRAEQLFRRTAVAEVAVLAAVLAVTAALAGTAPARVRASAAVAAGEITDCANAPIETASCWDRHFVALTKGSGPEAALDELDATAKAREYVNKQCHQLAHAIGRTTFEVAGDVAQALAANRASCASGYEHGVIEAAIAGLPETRLIADIPGFCAPRVYQRFSVQHYNCLHGLGHGVATLLSEDVFKAAPFCKPLQDPWEKEACYTGVFMQKVVGDFQRPSDGHDDDPVWPCRQVEPEMKRGCYIISTGRALRLFNYDYQAAFGACATVDREFVATCYESMGRDISSNTRLDPQRTLRLCSVAPNRDAYLTCLDAAVRNAMYDEHGTGKATALCDLLAAADRARCYQVRDDYKSRVGLSS